MSIIGEVDAWDVYSSVPSAFYYDGDDLSHIHSHGEENLKNYLTRELCSSLGWIGTRVNGLMLEIEVKQMGYRSRSSN